MYLNIAKPLPGSITLEYHDEDWSQTIDYEHIPFRCRKCHEHGHLFREFPLNQINKEGNPEGRKDNEGFTQQAGKRRQGGRRTATQVNKDPSTSNKFAILQDTPDNPVAPANMNAPLPNTQPRTEIPNPSKTSQNNHQDPSPSSLDQEPSVMPELEDADEEMEIEEQDLAGVDLEHLEHAYRHQKLYTIPRDQLRKVHKIFLNSSAGSTARASKALGIQGSQTKSTRKSQKEEKKRGRKSTNKLIQEIGNFMVNSGQIHLISDTFPPLPPPSSS